MIFNKYVLSLALIMATFNGLAYGADGSRAGGFNFTQVYADVLALGVGAGSGYTLAKIFNGTHLLSKFKDRPLSTTCIGLGLAAMAMKYREDIVSSIGGRRAVALSSASALIIFGLNLEFNSEGVSVRVNTPAGSADYRY